MSVWIFPASQEAFEEEGCTNPAYLYQNLRNTLNLANQRANTNYQTTEAVKADRAEARQLLAEATQRLQKRRPMLNQYLNRYRNSPCASTTPLNNLPRPTIKSTASKHKLPLSKPNSISLDKLPHQLTPQQDPKGILTLYQPSGQKKCRTPKSSTVIEPNYLTF
jgi:hypothetical protein